jgi:hypothetical protein
MSADEILALSRIVSACNVAGEGAKIALLSIQERRGAAAVLEEATYVAGTARTG